MVKLYKASSFKYTPFENFVDGDLDYLNKNQIEIVDKVKEADIIISQSLKHLKPHFWRGFFGKKFLIWTLEPRFNTSFESEIKVLFGLLSCHVMNIYTRDVFVSNITFHASKFSDTLDLLPKDFKLKSRKTIALMSYYKGLNSESLMRNGHNLDLIASRTEICLTGNELRLMDIYGKGWPKGISQEDSRDGEYFYRKRELMGKYQFNLCFENTATYDYMTEKIWDSIITHCLPIYYGKHTNAYNLFPKDSFIDYSDFNNPKELFDFINNMSDEEYVDRMNKCINVYNGLCNLEGDLVKTERAKMLNNIVLKVKLISTK